MRTALALGVTMLMITTAALAGPPASGKKKPAPAPPPASRQIAAGKALVEKHGCNTCHGADLAGKKGFSPSLRARGVLKEYNSKTWANLLNTGVTHDSGKVRPPMPVYHLKAADSAAILAYLETQK